jgi:hypothetical protein
MDSRRARDGDGRFRGARRNLDAVPRLPAKAISTFLADPRGIPYVALWTDQEDGRIARVSRLERGEWSEADEQRPGMVQLRDVDGDAGIGLVRVAMPRRDGQSHGERLLLTCFDCERARQHLYAASIDGGCDWLCRRCSGLRYASEGLYVGAKWWRAFTEESPWEPFVYSTPAIAAEAHGTRIDREPFLEAWYRLGTAPLRPRKRVEAPAPEPTAASVPPRVPSPTTIQPAPGDWNAIAMRARMAAVVDPRPDMRPIRPRGRGYW